MFIFDYEVQFQIQIQFLTGFLKLCQNSFEKNVEFCYAPFDIKKVKMKSLHPVHLPNRPRNSVGWSLVFERKSQIGLCFL